MKAKFAIVLVSLALIAAACNKQETVNPAPTPAPSPTPVSTNVISGETTISMTDSGFTPSTVTIKKGTKVNFVNNGTKLIWPASAPHPTHTDYAAFDPKKGIAAGATWSFTFDKTGAWGFHDHLNAGHFGKITVVE